MAEVVGLFTEVVELVMEEDDEDEEEVPLTK